MYVCMSSPEAALLLVSVTGRDSWCWPNGARSLRTRMKSQKWNHVVFRSCCSRVVSESFSKALREELLRHDFKYPNTPVTVPVSQALLGPVHTYPDIFESATFSFRIRLRSTRIQRIRQRIRQRVRIVLNPFSRVEKNKSATNPISCGRWIRIFSNPMT